MGPEGGNCACSSVPARRLCWVLGGILVLLPAAALLRGQVLSIVETGVGATEESVLQAELERLEEARTALAERRESAHSYQAVFLHSGASQTVCPVLGGPGPVLRLGLQPKRSPIRPRLAIAPPRIPWESVAQPGESPAGIFGDYLSSQVIQAKCIHCHVAGGISGHTRLVFTPSDMAGHQAANIAAFQGFLDDAEGGADLILNKIQGAAGHGGGVQVVPGSADFANMERFLRALGGETTSGGLSPETLFEGVTLASPEKTLRRAALLFAGRLPSQAELGAVRSGGEARLRRSIRELMQGPGFHEFLVRAANDQLLTDRERRDVVRFGEFKFVNLTNKRYELSQEAVANGYNEAPRRSPIYRQHEYAAQYGMARAPLELIAHVVENDLPYTEILTADYIMANPMAAEAYGADTEFEDPEDPFEFKPSKIEGYYRRHGSQVVEEDPVLGRRVLNPGILATEYPHAGVLNTTVFLKRYPTTATNRNRARSRWTYYHFLGVDIEKSAARTTDPDALADSNNPTMNNPACIVCHIPMDPVAGAYQNYGAMGLYRDKYGGLDSLPTLYKRPTDGTATPYQRGDTWFRDMRQPGFNGETAPSADNSLQWLAERIAADERFARAAVRFWWPAIMGVDLVEPPAETSDSSFDALRLAAAAQNLEVEELATSFRIGFRGGAPYNARDLLAEIALSPWFRAESITADDGIRTAALRDAGVERLLTPEELARKTEAIAGYVWGRRFSLPFGTGEARSKLHDPQGFSGYQLLYGGIDSDGIVERTGDMAPLMAAVAQSHASEVSCPIVRREFYYWPEGSRLLFDGISSTDTPVSEHFRAFEVQADSSEQRQLLQWEIQVGAGPKNIRLAYTNNRVPTEGPDAEEGLDRNLYLDRLVVRSSSGEAVLEVELESAARQSCGRPRGEFYQMFSNCSLDIPLRIPTAGTYTLVVVAHQDRAAEEDARLETLIEATDGNGSGAAAIRRKLADLHRKLYGVRVALDSPDVDEAYDLFVEVWNRKRAAENLAFSGSRMQCSLLSDHLYFEGILGDALEFGSGGASRAVSNDRIRELDSRIDLRDPNYTIRTWVVTLAYLLTDYRYLYF